MLEVGVLEGHGGLIIEIDRYIGRYLGFTNILVSAKTADIIGLSGC